LTAVIIAVVLIAVLISIYPPLNLRLLETKAEKLQATAESDEYEDIAKDYAALENARSTQEVFEADDARITEGSPGAYALYRQLTGELFEDAVIEDWYWDENQGMLVTFSSVSEEEVDNLLETAVARSLAVEETSERVQKSGGNIKVSLHITPILASGGAGLSEAAG